MAYIAPTPIRAEDPLAYFVGMPVPTPVLCPITALDQMYGYYMPAEPVVRR